MASESPREGRGVGMFSQAHGGRVRECGSERDGLVWTQGDHSEFKV